MNNLYLNNVFYRQDDEVKEYKEIFIETNLGFLKVNVTSLDFININTFQSLTRLNEIDSLKEKYGDLCIEEVRRTYDNDIYILISGKFLFVIEYVLNSRFEHSTQEFRIIEELHGINKAEFEEFKELEIVKLTS